jgi:hypothetical protein
VVHLQTTWVVDESGKGNFTSLDAIYSYKVKPGDIVYMRGTVGLIWGLVLGV